MLKYTLNPNHTGPYMMAGPTIGLKLSSQVLVRQAGILNSVSYSAIDGKTKFIDFGLGFGAGLNVPKGNHAVFVEARYVLGLTNINDASEANVRNKGLQIFTGITFPFR